MPEPITNQRAFPNVGVGLSLNQFQSTVTPWIEKATQLIDSTQVVVAARNAMNSPKAELQALTWARNVGNWSPAAEQHLTSRITELTKFVHDTEGGAIRF